MSAAAAITPSSEPYCVNHLTAVSADLGDAGDVIDGIADQRQVNDDTLRRYAELGQHPGLVERFVRC